MFAIDPRDRRALHRHQLPRFANQLSVNMKNEPLNTDPGVRRDVHSELMIRLSKSRRLQAGDKPIFARNLGSLAARVSPNDPLEGARLIVNQAGHESLWPTKRKKYFRLPNEDAPSAGKSGEYASNPAQFRKLAEAAGELLCTSAKPDKVEASRQACTKTLVRGSSFMPIYVPADATTQSAADLLDEYALAVGSAVENRTRIVELWEILQHTPIGLEIFSDETVVEAEPSPYGEVSNFPRSLLQPLFAPHITHGRLSPSRGYHCWAEPLLKIGSLAHERAIRIFCIPPEKQSLFPPSLWSHRRLTPEAIEWMVTVGFAPENASFPPLEMSSTDCGWKEAKAALLQDVSVGFEYSDDERLGLELRLSGNWPFALEVGSGAGALLIEKAGLAADPKMTQHFTCEVGEYFPVDVIFSAPFDPTNPSDVHAIGLLPDGWQYDTGEYEEVKEFAWIKEREMQELNEHDCVQGWTDDEYIAKFLLDDAGVFIPALPNEDPVGGILPAGSIGAALLQNAKVAQGASRISQLLIDRAALIADTGLAFYEAMVEEYRSAIRNI